MAREEGPGHLPGWYQGWPGPPLHRWALLEAAGAPDLSWFHSLLPHPRLLLALWAHTQLTGSGLPEDGLFLPLCLANSPPSARNWETTHLCQAVPPDLSGQHQPLHSERQAPAMGPALSLISLELAHLLPRKGWALE